MRIALIGSRWFGAQVLELLRERREEIFVVAPDMSDRLAMAAEAAGVPCALLNGRRQVRPEDLPDSMDLVVAAHSHAFIPAEIRAKAKRAAIGYHPSLLPRHRGIAAVEWTIRCGDPIAGGSVYHLTDEMDAGPIAAQDWCFVHPGEDAGSLWRRALAPMGLKLLAQVVDYVGVFGCAEAREQEKQAITFAPPLKARLTPVPA